MSDNLYTPPSAPVSDQTLATGRDVEIREAHIRHEGSLRAFGLLHYIIAAFLFIGAVGLLVAGLAGGDALRDADGMGPSLFIGIAVGYVVFGALLFWVGRGLRALRSSVRIPAIILAAIGLLGFPLGTLLNAYLLYLLLSAKGQMVLSDEYAGVRERTPDMKVPTSILVWVVLGIFVLGVGSAIVIPMLQG